MQPALRSIHILALLLIAATAWLYASGMATDISLDNLQAHEMRLRAEVAANPLLALAVFSIMPRIVRLLEK